MTARVSLLPAQPRASLGLRGAAAVPSGSGQELKLTCRPGRVLIAKTSAGGMNRKASVLLDSDASRRPHYENKLGLHQEQP